VLLASAPEPAMTMYGIQIGPYVRARWVAPGGIPHTGEILAPVGAKAGSTVMVWVGGSGQLADDPSAQSGWEGIHP
jgi:hypothetical protein